MNNKMERGKEGRNRVRWRFVSMLVASHLATIALSVQLCTLWNLHQSQQEQELFTIPETAIRPQDLLTIPETAISPQELLTITETDVSTARRIDQNRTMNVLFGMQGKSQVFIDEWEVSLKSILLNAPIDASLHIHIVANNAARVAVSEKIQKVGLEGTRWRNPVTITVYDVEKYQKEWTAFIQQQIRKWDKIDQRVTLGGHYRLLAFKVLPPSVGPVIYMDTDVVILTNLDDLWTWQWIQSNRVHSLQRTTPKVRYILDTRPLTALHREINRIRHKKRNFKSTWGLADYS